MQGFNPNVPYVSHGDGKQLKFSQGFALWVSQGKAKQPKGGSKLSRIDIFMSDPAAPMATKVDLNLSPKTEESVRYCWWKKSCTGWYDYLQGFIHVRWCRTSSIDSTKRTWVDQFTTLAGIWMQMFHLGSFESLGPQIGNLSGSILIHFPVDQHDSTEKLKIPLPCSFPCSWKSDYPEVSLHSRSPSPSRTTGSSIILGLPQQTKRQISNLWPKLGEAWLPYNTIYVCAIMQQHTISVLLNMFVLSMCVYDVLLQNANHAASLIIRYDSKTILRSRISYDIQQQKNITYLSKRISDYVASSSLVCFVHVSPPCVIHLALHRPMHAKSLRPCGRNKWSPLPTNLEPQLWIPTAFELKSY